MCEKLNVLDMSVNSDSIRSWFWTYLKPFTKFWGILTSVVLSGVGVDILFHNHVIGYYIILATLVLFFLEIGWVITLFLNICIHSEYSRIFTCWNKILWIKDWRKTILYIAFATPLILKPHHLWLSTVAAIMLIILGILHFLHQWEANVKTCGMVHLLQNEYSYINSCEVNDPDIAESQEYDTTECVKNNEKNGGQV